MEAAVNFEAPNVVPPSGMDVDSFVRDLDQARPVQVWGVQGCIVRAAPDLGENVLRFILATEGIKRDGNSVALHPEAWIYDDFWKHPAMLWAHDYGSEQRTPLPQIGEWLDVRNEKYDGGWWMVGEGRLASWELPKILWQTHAPKELGGDGMRAAVSIGWTPEKSEPISGGGRHMTLNRLNEASMVPMGADADAVQRMIRSGAIPEHLGRDVLEQSRGRAYVLDWREPVEETRTEKTDDADPTGNTRTDTSDKTEPAAEPDSTRSAPATEQRSDDDPEVCIVGRGDERHAPFTLPTGERSIAFVLECRDGSDTDENHVRSIATKCRSALAERQRPDLGDGWRAIPVVAGRSLVLHGPADAEPEHYRAIREALTSSLEAGKQPVLSTGWRLMPASRAATADEARSGRSEALDTGHAMLWGLVNEMRDPLHRLYWAVDTIFWRDEIDGSDVASDETAAKHAARDLALLQNLCEMSQRVASEMADIFTPDPTGDATIPTESEVGDGSETRKFDVTRLIGELDEDAKRLREEGLGSVSPPTDTRAGVPANTAPPEGARRSPLQNTLDDIGRSSADLRENGLGGETRKDDTTTNKEPPKDSARATVGRRRQWWYYRSHGGLISAVTARGGRRRNASYAPQTRV